MNYKNILPAAILASGVIGCTGAEFQERECLKEMPEYTADFAQCKQTPGEVAITGADQRLVMLNQNPLWMKYAEGTFLSDYETVRSECKRITDIVQRDVTLMCNFYLLDENDVPVKMKGGEKLINEEMNGQITTALPGSHPVIVEGAWSIYSCNDDILSGAVEFNGRIGQKGDIPAGNHYAAPIKEKLPNWDVPQVAFVKLEKPAKAQILCTLPVFCPGTVDRYDKIISEDGCAESRGYGDYVMYSKEDK